MERQLRRLAARGTYEITPWGDSQNFVCLRFWPHGQKGNPFCSHQEIRSTLAGAVTVMLDRTEPRRDTIDNLAWYRQIAKERADAKASASPSSATPTSPGNPPLGPEVR